MFTTSHMPSKADFIQTVTTRKVDFHKLAKARNGENTTKLINYLKASKTQYPNLSKENEQELIDKYKDDRETLNKLLFMHHVRLVFNICLKYYFKTSDFDDMVGRALMGLAEAADRFEPERDNKFSTYATWWIYKRVMEEFQTKEIKHGITMVSLNNGIDTAVSGNNPSDEFEDYLNFSEYLSAFYDFKDLSTPLSQVQSFEAREILDDIYNYVETNTKFTEQEINIFKKIFREGNKIKDISAETGLSSFRIKQTKNKIMKNVREMLLSKYNISNIAELENYAEEKEA